MPPAPTTPPGAPPATSPSSPLAWLRTREGRIVAGGGAVVLVVVVALARRGGGGFSADALQTGPDETLQDRLDQLGMRGGTLEELIGSTSDLTSGLADLTSRIDRLDDTDATPTGASERARLTALRASYIRQLQERATARRVLLQAPKGPGNYARIKQLEGQMRPLQRAIARVEEQLRALVG